MAQKKEQYWGSSTLKERGWTKELFPLLPPPVIRYYHNRRTRLWRVTDVLAAEKSEEFRSKAVKRPAPPPTDASACRALCEKQANELSAAWSAARFPAGLMLETAERMHRAILARLPALSWESGMRGKKCGSSVEAFLQLRRGSGTVSAYDVLRRFIAALPWLARCAPQELRVRVTEAYPQVLYAIVERETAAFAGAHPDTELATVLHAEPVTDDALLQYSFSYLYSVFYVPSAIRSSLKLLVALNPQDEYPLARAMKRHFILHIGGTNTGKTYAGFQRLCAARTGVYLAPLRLLALEAQETMLNNGVDCSLTTGEEEDCREGDTHVAATAEKLDISTRYDVAVIDECQMIADRQRGFAWTRAILGVLAPEVHLCAAPEAKELLIRIIESTGDTWEVIEHRRRTPLICMEHATPFSNVRPGDALITFSKVGVLSVAEDLRQQGKKPAIIYGALPYSTRRKQMDAFLSGETQYIVSTDAIGMGLNLPIRRILFMETRKFDGIERRDLTPAEIRQIAGRAGRYGMYERGYVGATENIEDIRYGLEQSVPPLTEAIAGFSELVLQVDFDLLQVLTEWSKMPTVAPYVKLDISRYIALITKLRNAGFSLPKEQELACANIPFDETEEELLELLFSFLSAMREGQPIVCPVPEELYREHTLPELERFCRMLDLYFSFTKAFSIPIDRDALYEKREELAECINQILLHNLQNNIRFCDKCGAALPLHRKSRLCAACYRKSVRYPRPHRY